MRGTNGRVVLLCLVCVVLVALGAGGGACQAALVAEAGPDKTVALGWDTTLEGSASGGVPPYSYSWSPAAGLADAHAAQPTASPAATTTYTLTVTDSDSPPSSDTDAVTVNVLSFTDVPTGFWAHDETRACATAEIVMGYPGGLYRPGESVTRAQMAVYAARAVAGSDVAIPSGPETPSFSDVGTDHWAYRYVEYAVAQQIVQGYPGGTYHPDEAVNRGQMAVYIARAMVAPAGDAAVPPDTDGATFTDVAATGDWSWCYNHVEYLAAGGIVTGYWDDTYRPGNAVTRDQMAVYIQRAFDLPVPGANPFAGTYAASYSGGATTIVVDEHGGVALVVVVDNWVGAPTVLIGSGVLSNAGILNASAEGDSGLVTMSGLFANSGGTITASGSLTGAVSGGWTGDRIADPGENAFTGHWSGTYTGMEWGTWEADIEASGDVTATAHSPSVGTVSLTGHVALTGSITEPLQGSGTGIGGPFTITWEGVFYMEGAAAVGAGTWTSSSGLFGDWTGARE